MVYPKLNFCGPKIGLCRFDLAYAHIILSLGGIQIALADRFFLGQRLDPVQIGFRFRFNRFGTGHTAHLGRHIRLELLAFNGIQEHPFFYLGTLFKMDPLQIPFNTGRNTDVLEPVNLPHKLLVEGDFTCLGLVNTHLGWGWGRLLGFVLGTA